MAYKFQYGDRLVVELTNGDVIYGDHVRSLKHMIELKNIEEKYGRAKKSGVTRYFRGDISNVFIVQKKSDQQESPTNKSEEHEEETPKTPGEEDLRKRDYLLDRFLNASKNHVYITDIDENYEKAFAVFKNCESIGVVGIGSNRGRREKLTLLILSTWKLVYVFDCCELENSTHFFQDMKHLLESYQKLKVLFDGKMLVDCLRHNYDINVNHVFDPMVADVQLQRRNKTKNCEVRVRSLCEIVHYYLGFPKYILQRAVDIKVSSWRQRPLNDEYKIRAAELCMVLVMLKEKIKSIMLNYHYLIVKDVYKYYLSLPAFQAKLELEAKEVSPTIIAIIRKHLNSISTSTCDDDSLSKNFSNLTVKTSNTDKPGTSDSC